MTETAIVICVMSLLCCFLLQMILVPVYLHRCNKGKRCKVVKMICSAFYIAAGIMAPYALQFRLSAVGAVALAGLFCAWLGDLLLDGKKSNKYETAGGLAYIAMNIAFAVALSLQNYNKPTRKYRFELYEIPVLIAILGLFLLLYKISKAKTDKKAIPIAYCLSFSVLFARGVSLTVYNAKMYPQMSVIVLSGCLMLFVAGTVGMRNLYTDKNSKWLNNLGIVAYYIAQNAFALFIGVAQLGWNGQVSLLT